MELSRPKITKAVRTRISPWVTLVEKTVLFPGQTSPQIYHCLTQAAYVSILAVTSDGSIPLIRQFRPCVEDYTLEFPGGTLDGEETAEEAAVRELKEEVGLTPQSIVALGEFYPDTGRLDLPSYGFLMRTGRADSDFRPEEGTSIHFVTPEELRVMIVTGDFRVQFHLGVYGAILARGLTL